MTTTPQVDLAEARNIADCIELMASDSMHEDAVKTIRALADEVEALREANDKFAQRQEWWNERMVNLESELAALKAVGPDGLPPLPPAATNMLLGDDWEDLFTADQMNSHYRVGYQHGSAAIAAQKPIVQHRKIGCADWFDGYADHTDGNGPYEERTIYLALAQKGGA